MKPQELLRRLYPPMLATLADAPPAEDHGWSYELKYDGFRAVTAIIGGELAMWSRNGLDLAPRFPRITAALRKLKITDVVIDGEIVALDEKGAPRFQLLQQGDRIEKLYVFDILWLGGKDLRRLTCDERRKILEKALSRTPREIAVAQRLAMSGQEAIKHATEGGFEGIIAKKRSSCYEPRRSKEWLKVKALRQQELVIVGYQPSTHSAREVGSLHLAYKGDDGEFHYAGKVGTGFSYKLRVWFKDVLSKETVPAPPVTGAPRIRDATWVRPRLVAQVAFTEWTSDDRLRHPSFLGLRDDKSPDEVVKEKPMKSGGTPAKAAAKGKKARAAAPVVNLTNPDRLIYPRDGITKKDVVAYFEAMAGPMIATLRDRPLALEHWNQGIDSPSWFHQNIGREAPEWVTSIETPTRTTKRSMVRHLVVDRPETLRWLGQMSALTIHMWSSRGASLEEPDWLLFDLDPAKGKGIEQAIEAAVVIRALLENLELPGVPKTSGKRGIHVFVPLVPGHTHEQVTDFACQIAAAVAAKVPGITVERSIAKRRGRLYLDCMQNGYGKTVVAPYSLRAIDGAPVSAPLKWSEITKRLDPSRYNIRTMPDRVAKVGDLFAAVFKDRVKLPVLQ